MAHSLYPHQGNQLPPTLGAYDATDPFGIRKKRLRGIWPDTTQEAQLSGFPTDEPVAYEPFDLQAFTQREAGEQRAFIAKSNAERRSLINNEIRRNNSLRTVVNAFTGRSGGYGKLISEVDSKAASKVSEDDIEADQIWKMWQDLVAEGTAPRDKISLEQWIEAVNPSLSGMEVITDKIGPEYDWGDWKQLKKLNPDNPYGKPLTAWAQVKSPRYVDLLRQGYHGESLVDDKATLNHETAVDVVSRFNRRYKDPKESDFNSFMQGLTNPIEIAAMQAHRKSFGYDNPREIFIDDEGDFHNLQRGTEAYNNAIANEWRKSSESEWATVVAADERKKREGILSTKFAEWKQVAGNAAQQYPDKVLIEKWVWEVFADKLELLGGTGNSVSDVVNRFYSTIGAATVMRERYDALSERIEQEFDNGNFNKASLYKITEDSDLPDTGDFSKETLQSKIDKRLAVEVPQRQSFPTQIIVDGQTIYGTQLGHVDRNGNVVLDPTQPFIPTDPNITITQEDMAGAFPGDPQIRKVEGLGLSAAGKVEQTKIERQEWEAVMSGVSKLQAMPGIKEASEGYRDVHRKFSLIDGALRKFVELGKDNKLAAGNFDQFMADLWKKLTDESMITSEEFRVLTKGDKPLNAWRLKIANLMDQPRGRGAFLTGPARRVLITMARLALDYKKKQATGLLAGYETEWSKTSRGKQVVGLALAPELAFLREAIPELNLDDPVYADAFWGEEEGVTPTVTEGITSQASEGEDLTWNVREGKMQDAAGNFYYLGEDGLYHRE